MGLLETYYHIRDYHDYVREPYQLKHNEAVEVLAAMQRQLPKKAIIVAAGEKTISGVCSNCGAELVYLRSKKNMSYCPDCGQKIDWTGGQR